MTRRTGQIAGSNLPPSEQLGLGGTETIPGYDERTANGSQGVLLASQELLSPAFSVINQLFQSDLRDQAQLSGFWAYGNVTNRGAAGTSTPPIWRARRRLALRWGTYVTLRAIRLAAAQASGATDHGAFGHVALTLSLLGPLFFRGIGLLGREAGATASAPVFTGHGRAGDQIVTGAAIGANEPWTG